MNIIDKLQYYKEKIRNSTVLDRELGELIGIELFDFIHGHKELQSELYKRVKYFYNLEGDKDFADIQDKLYEAIVKILKLVNLSQIQNLQKEWKSKIIVGLKNHKEDFLTLPELYKALLKKDNYYRLGDKTAFCPTEGDILYTPTTFIVKQQYKIVERLFDLIVKNIIAEDKPLSEKNKNLIEDYNKVWYQFSEKIHSIPTKLHIKAFVNFFYFCVAVYSREGYEDHHNIFHDILYRENVDYKDYKLEEIKKTCNTIIDDLTELVRDETKIFEEKVVSQKLDRPSGTLATQISVKDQEIRAQDKNCLKSIHLITDCFEPSSVIFLVLDERFEMPIRCATHNNMGQIAYIKRLYDIAYSYGNAPGKRVNYNGNLAGDINNGLFKRRRVAEYMKTNKFRKPTLVQKSENGEYLVLKNEILVKTGLVKHNVPLQYQSLYIDKTR